MSLKDNLKKHFGYDTFRPQQQEIIETEIAGNDVLVLMPTGAGKSLCFQLPAIISPGVTIVISPLISLIQDQVDELRKRNVVCYYLNSMTSASERHDLFDALDNIGTKQEPKCRCKLLYTTPETLNNNQDFIEKCDEIYENGLLRGFVIDEAHCVSNWGHDFRDNYLELKTIKEYYPLIPIWCFTATATPKVQLDIIKQLNLQKPKIFRSSFIRHNLSYQIYEKSSSSTVQYQIKNLIKQKYNGLSGIIYCLSRNQCEELSNYLQSQKISCDYYHAQMPGDRKTKVQNQWLDGKIKIIVATIAFALGINKRDVRFIMHSSLPKSIESYYQETGRAGRDGLHSDCILFYNNRDRMILTKMVQKNQEERENDNMNEAPTKNRTRIDMMYALCQNIYDCTKMQLSHYLGEYLDYSCHKSDSEQENMCLNCSKPKKHSITDFTDVGLAIIKLISNSNKELSRSKILLTLNDQFRRYNVAEINRVINWMITMKYLRIRVFQSEKTVLDSITLGQDSFTDKKIMLKYHRNIDDIFSSSKLSKIAVIKMN